MNLQAEYVTDQKGTRKAMILPISDYEEILEDIHDLAVIAERVDEPVIPLERVKERLKKDGLLRR